MDQEAASILRAELGPDEHLLWAGRPPRGVLLRPADAFLIPFSILWTGFIVFWESSVLRENAPSFFAIWGIPFLLMGAYILAGRFFVDAWMRARTAYGLTNERVIIVREGPSRNVTSLPLRTVSDMAISVKRDGRGTITFGSAPSMRLWQGAAWPGTSRYAAPSFQQIPEAREVYERIRRAQAGAA